MLIHLKTLGLCSAHLSRASLNCQRVERVVAASRSPPQNGGMDKLGIERVIVGSGSQGIKCEPEVVPVQRRKLLAPPDDASLSSKALAGGASLYDCDVTLCR